MWFIYVTMVMCMHMIHGFSPNNQKGKSSLTALCCACVSPYFSSSSLTVTQLSHLAWSIRIKAPVFHPVSTCHYSFVSVVFLVMRKIIFSNGYLSNAKTSFLYRETAQIFLCHDGSNTPPYLRLSLCLPERYKLTPALWEKKPQYRVSLILLYWV